MKTRIEKMEEKRSRKWWGEMSVEQRCGLIASHYTRLANAAMNLKALTEFQRECPTPSNAEAIALLYRMIEEDHRRTFGVAPAWSIIRL